MASFREMQSRAHAHVLHTARKANINDARLGMVRSDNCREVTHWYSEDQEWLTNP